MIVGGRGRKKKHQEHVNHERWLVSYADFITLLFAFFVVMFASSQTDKGRAQQVSESVKKALEGEHLSAVFAALLRGAPDQESRNGAVVKGPEAAINRRSEEHKDEKLVELLPSLELLTEALKAEIAAGRVQIDMQSRGLVISFTQAALFPSGEDLISPDTYASIEKVASAVAKIPNPVRFEGHTDSVPISTPRFRSNWQLSTARSIALLEILVTRYGVPPGRLSVAGYADTAPVASNDTEEGRARNRRVDIIILNQQGVMAEPEKLEPKPLE